MSFLRRFANGVELAGRTVQAVFGFARNTVVEGHRLPGPYPVDTTGATDGQVPVFNASAGKFVPGAGGGGGGGSTLTVALAGDGVRSNKTGGGSFNVVSTRHDGDFDVDIIEIGEEPGGGGDPLTRLHGTISLAEGVTFTPDEGNVRLEGGVRMPVQNGGLPAVADGYAALYVWDNGGTTELRIKLHDDSIFVVTLTPA